MKNAFTIDVEDYFHVAAFAGTIDMASWAQRQSRVEWNTQALLCLLAQRGIHATFFVLGWVAKRYPGLVREIARNGHEIACHGLNHQLVYKQSEAEFREETRYSKRLLEDIVQRPVIGYRAATYSITNRSLWALDVLAEEGYLYDSSVFPMRHDKYGIPDAKSVPHRLRTSHGNTIAEFPISVVKMGGLTLPVGGGGYFRILPYSVIKWGLKRLNKAGQEFVFYIHPWEIDPFQPRIDQAPMLSRFRHYSNLQRCHHRLTKLLGDFSFAPLVEVLRERGLLSEPSVNTYAAVNDRASVAPAEVAKATPA